MNGGKVLKCTKSIRYKYTICDNLVAKERYAIFISTIKTQTMVIDNKTVEKALNEVARSILDEQQLTETSQRLTATANQFIEEHTEMFTSAEEVSNYTEELCERMQRYFEALNDLLSGDRFYHSATSAIRHTLYSDDLNWFYIRIKELMGDMLLEVFVSNETENFKNIIGRILKRRQWKQFARLPFMAVMNPEMHTIQQELLHRMLRAFEAQCLAYEPEPEQQRYVHGLLALLAEMRATVESMMFHTQAGGLAEQTGTAPQYLAEAVAIDKSPVQLQRPEFPSWIFSSEKAFGIFCKVHDSFCRSESDLAYLYRRTSDARLVVSGMATFKDWYNNWEGRRFETWNHFRTLARLENTRRATSYNLACAHAGFST